MRVAALYDIHGNLPALEAVLREVRAAGVDQIVVGGDVIPGPLPLESLAALRELEVPVLYLSGNGEREVLAAKAGVENGALPEAVREVLRWSAGELDAGAERWIVGWPRSVRLEIPPLGEVLFCHATPRSDTEIFTRRTPEERLLPLFAGLGVGVSMVVCGHTHMPFDRTIGSVRVVNAGSVGMPFGEPGADWLLLGPGIEPRRTRYDLARAAERIRATPYPQAEDFAARSVLDPPSESEMLERLAAAEPR
jgi:predicted phosphodiesterase